MSDNKLREALAYEQGCRDTWNAVRGTNADMRPDASAAYITCVQAAKTMLEKATLARAALSTPPSKADVDDVERKLAAAEARLAEAVEQLKMYRDDFCEGHCDGGPHFYFDCSGCRAARFIQEDEK